MLVLGCATLILGACSDPSASLIVEVRTDLTPGLEVDSVQTARLDAVGGAPVDVRTVAAGIGDPFGEGVRVAELDGLPLGTHAIRVRLSHGGLTALERTVLVTLRNSRAVTVVLTRRCRSVTCPGAGDDPAWLACLGGRCVSPACTPETPEACPAEPECRAPSDCEVTAACADPDCAGGACLLVGRPGACGADAWCDPDEGCVGASGRDAGVADAAIDVDASVEACTSGVFAGSEYLFCRGPGDLLIATASCAVWDPASHLVDIGSLAEQEWLVAEVASRLMLGTPNGFYTGGSDVDEEGVWRWSDGTVFHRHGVAVGFDNGFSESATGDEDYLEALQRGGWNDMGPDARRAWVCERPAP